MKNIDNLFNAIPERAKKEFIERVEKEKTELVFQYIYAKGVIDGYSEAYTHWEDNDTVEFEHSCAYSPLEINLPQDIKNILDNPPREEDEEDFF